VPRSKQRSNDSFPPFFDTKIKKTIRPKSSLVFRIVRGSSSIACDLVRFFHLWHMPIWELRNCICVWYIVFDADKTKYDLMIFIKHQSNTLFFWLVSIFLTRRMFRYAPRFHGKKSKNFPQNFLKYNFQKKSPKKNSKKKFQKKIQKSKNFYA
jgi:hypothetical protein